MFMFRDYTPLINLASISGDVNSLRVIKRRKAERNQCWLKGRGWRAAKRKLKIKAKKSGGGAESGGFVGGGGLEASEKKCAGFGVIGSDDFERAGGTGEFAESTLSNEVINMFGDSGNRGKAEGSHDFAVGGRDAVRGQIIMDEFHDESLFFGKFGRHML